MKLKKLIGSLPFLTLALTSVNANERICVNKTPDLEQKKIIETVIKNSSSGVYEALQEVKNTSPESYNNVISITTADINNDGKEEIFYTLGHPLSGNCGYDVGVITNIDNGKWKEVLANECYSECFALLNSSKNGFRDILNLDARDDKGMSKCVFSPSRGKYKCSSIRPR
jgi:hypothetical protein